MKKNDSARSSITGEPIGVPEANEPQNSRKQSRLQSGAPTAATQPAPVDLQRETVVPFREVPKLGIIPMRRQGSRLNLRTLYRWCAVGVRGVKLPYQLLGSQRVTSVEALVRFFAAVSAASRSVIDAKTPAFDPSPMPDVETELDRLGL